MKKLFYIISLIFLSISSFAQKLSQIVIAGSASSNVLSFFVDETVFINITPDGKIIEWGIENPIRKQYTYNYPQKLDKYMGREEYYDSTANDGSRGKVKYIGRTAITYYSSEENDKWKGKLKSIGPIMIDYYPFYEDAAFRGKIKNAGSFLFTYYSSFDDAAYRGKLKSVGSTNITYYTSFDDKAFRGKVKNIDGQPFVYYSSYDRKEYGGQLKTGNRISFFGGVKYYIIN